MGIQIHLLLFLRVLITGTLERNSLHSTLIKRQRHRKLNPYLVGSKYPRTNETLLFTICALFAIFWFGLDASRPNIHQRKQSSARRI